MLLQLPKLVPYIPALQPYLPFQDLESISLRAFSYSEAIKIAAPAVVSINSEQQVLRQREVYLDNNPFRKEWENILDKSNSLGSGVIISPDGYIITSYHVIVSSDEDVIDPNAGDHIVTLSDGRDIKARVLMVDEENDLALLRIDADHLPYIGPAVSETLQVGDIALAIGNPRNIGQSVSLGIISALLRQNDSYVIQTDAAINPGNSGGALINIYGNLIGINSTIVSDSGGSEGIGFAIPAQTAINLMETYINSGPSGYLGINSTEIISESEGLQIYGIAVQGILVSEVTLNSPADKAGIRAQDLITAVDNNKIKTAENAISTVNFISSKKPGDTILVEVYRDGEYLQLPTVLGVGEPNLSFQFIPIDN